MVLETKLTFFFSSFFCLNLFFFFFFPIFFVCVSERILCIPVCRGVSGSRRSAWIIWTISSTVFRFSWKEGQWCLWKGNDWLLFVGVLKKTAHELWTWLKSLINKPWVAGHHSFSIFFIFIFIFSVGGCYLRFCVLFLVNLVQRPMLYYPNKNYIYMYLYVCMYVCIKKSKDIR